jgi:hypothetical protein
LPGGDRIGGVGGVVRLGPPDKAIDMTIHKDLKQSVRERAARTGDSALYAGFLDEAADALGKPDLTRAVTLFRASRATWSAIATTARHGADTAVLGELADAVDQARTSGSTLTPIWVAVSHAADSASPAPSRSRLSSPEPCRMAKAAARWWFRRSDPSPGVRDRARRLPRRPDSWPSRWPGRRCRTAGRHRPSR